MTIPNGAIVTDIGLIGYSDDRAYGVAVQNDDKIVVAGLAVNGSTGGFAVARYLSNGLLDATFDQDGKVFTTIGSFGVDQGFAVALQKDGKILVTGSGQDVDKLGFATSGFALIRYNSDGSLDTDFGNQGSVITQVDTQYSTDAQSVVVDGAGKILIAGSSYNGKDLDFSMVRYNSDGSLDTSFAES